VSAALEFGLPGLGLQPGDHFCGFFFGRQERDELLLPFLEAGLRAGDKCICVVDSTEPSAVLMGIDGGIDTDGCVASEQLAVFRATEAYLRTGGFSPKDMIEFLDDSVSAATTDGKYDFVRTAGEASWALDGPPGADDLIEYESKLNTFSPQYRQAILCLYDLERFGGAMLVDLLRTHPKLLIGGLIIDNPHYLSPEEFLAARR